VLEPERWLVVVGVDSVASVSLSLSLSLEFWQVPQLVLRS